MTIDLAAALRRIKPEKHLAQLDTRPTGRAGGMADTSRQAGSSVMLDTNVYIMSAAGILPTDIAALLNRSLLFHCSVCLGELATGIANADPMSSNWRALVMHYRSLFVTLPETRVLVPTDDIWVEAGLVAGTLARTQRFQPHQRKECLNDALIFLTAAAGGMPVLTSDRRDFELIQQLAPWGRCIHFKGER